MGEYFVNYQIKTDSASSVIREVGHITRTQAYVSPPKNGWVSVYDQMSDLEFKYREINDFGKELSIKISTVVLIIVVFGGVNFLYFLYDEGELVDEFYDNPRAGFEFGFTKATKAVVERFKGHPEKLFNYCPQETKMQEICDCLKFCREGQVDYLGDGGAWHFASLFGIDEYRATSGYNYFEKFSLDEENPDLEDAKSFLLVRRAIN